MSSAKWRPFVSASMCVNEKMLKGHSLSINCIIIIIIIIIIVIIIIIMCIIIIILLHKVLYSYFAWFFEHRNYEWTSEFWITMCEPERKFFCNSIQTCNVCISK